MLLRLQLESTLSVCGRAGQAVGANSKLAPTACCDERSLPLQRTLHARSQCHSRWEALYGAFSLTQPR